MVREDKTQYNDYDHQIFSILSEIRSKRITLAKTHEIHLVGRPNISSLDSDTRSRPSPTRA